MCAPSSNPRTERGRKMKKKKNKRKKEINL
jgi:hypothetical protein